MYDNDFLFFFVNLDTVFNNLILEKKSPTFEKLKTVGITAMTFETVRIHFFGNFHCRCRRGCFLFCCCCCCFLIVIFLSVVGDWHKFYACFFASYFHEQLVSILC